jgi:hypothetical protein
MIKQAGSAGYVSMSGGKIAALLVISICSFALALAARTSMESAQPSMGHISQAPMRTRNLSHAKGNRSTAIGQAHTHHKHRALSNSKRHIKQSARVGHSKQQAGQGGAQGADQAAAEDVDQEAGEGAKPKSDATPSPTPEESPSTTSDSTTLGWGATTTDTSRWPRAAATPAPSP